MGKISVNWSTLFLWVAKYAYPKVAIFMSILTLKYQHLVGFKKMDYKFGRKCNRFSKWKQILNISWVCFRFIETDYGKDIYMHNHPDH